MVTDDVILSLTPLGSLFTVTVTVTSPHVNLLLLCFFYPYDLVKLNSLQIQEITRK